jgi:diamine N-acetyltransferase
MDINIRKADKKDAKLISALGVTTFYEAYFETDEPAHIAAYIARTYDPEQIENELNDKNSTFFIAEIEGKAVGFAKLRENSVPDCLAGDNTIELHRIYLVERVWRKGFGRKLIERCLSEAKTKGCDSLWLGTWEENVRAQKFYEQLGFTHVGEYKYLYEGLPATNFVYKIDLE